MSKLDDLKKEANDLGITFSGNIGQDKLQAKINDFYESQESTGADIENAVKAQEEVKKAEQEAANKQEAVAKRKAKDIYALAQEAEEKARETKVVTINDNDNRVNNHTTIATVNCSNQYFDLGTVRIPLNEPVEIFKGHLDALREIMIPMHVTDNASGLSKVVVRPRYALQEHEKKEVK